MFNDSNIDYSTRIREKFDEIYRATPVPKELGNSVLLASRPKSSHTPSTSAPTDRLNPHETSYMLNSSSIDYDKDRTLNIPLQGKRAYSEKVFTQTSTLNTPMKVTDKLITDKSIVPSVERQPYDEKNSPLYKLLLEEISKPPIIQPPKDPSPWRSYVNSNQSLNIDNSNNNMKSPIIPMNISPNNGTQNLIPLSQLLAQRRQSSRKDSASSMNKSPDMLTPTPTEISTTTIRNSIISSNNITTPTTTYSNINNYGNKELNLSKNYQSYSHNNIHVTPPKHGVNHNDKGAHISINSSSNNGSNNKRKNEDPYISPTLPSSSSHYDTYDHYDEDYETHIPTQNQVKTKTMAISSPLPTSNILKQSSNGIAYTPPISSNNVTSDKKSMNSIPNNKTTTTNSTTANKHIYSMSSSISHSNTKIMATTTTNKNMNQNQYTELNVPIDSQSTLPKKPSDTSTSTISTTQQYDVIPVKKTNQVTTSSTSSSSVTSSSSSSSSSSSVTASSSSSSSSASSSSSSSLPTKSSIIPTSSNTTTNTTQKIHKSSTLSSNILFQSTSPEKEKKEKVNNESFKRHMNEEDISPHKVVTKPQLTSSSTSSSPSSSSSKTAVSSSSSSSSKAGVSSSSSLLSNNTTDLSTTTTTMIQDHHYNDVIHKDLHPSTSNIALNSTLLDDLNKELQILKQDLESDMIFYTPLTSPLNIDSNNSTYHTLTTTTNSSHINNRSHHSSSTSGRSSNDWQLTYDTIWEKSWKYEDIDQLLLQYKPSLSNIYDDISIPINLISQENNSNTFIMNRDESSIEQCMDVDNKIEYTSSTSNTKKSNDSKNTIDVEKVSAIITDNVDRIATESKVNTMNIYKDTVVSLQSHNTTSIIQSLNKDSSNINTHSIVGDSWKSMYQTPPNLHNLEQSLPQTSSSSSCSSWNTVQKELFETRMNRVLEEEWIDSPTYDRLYTQQQEQQQHVSSPTSSTCTILQVDQNDAVSIVHAKQVESSICKDEGKQNDSSNIQSPNYWSPHDSNDMNQFDISTTTMHNDDDDDDDHKTKQSNSMNLSVTAAINNNKSILKSSRLSTSSTATMYPSSNTLSTTTNSNNNDKKKYKHTDYAYMTTPYQSQKSNYENDDKLTVNNKDDQDEVTSFRRQTRLRSRSLSTSSSNNIISSPSTTLTSQSLSTPKSNSHHHHTIVYEDDNDSSRFKRLTRSSTSPSSPTISSPNNSTTLRKKSILTVSSSIIEETKVAKSNNRLHQNISSINNESLQQVSQKKSNKTTNDNTDKNVKKNDTKSTIKCKPKKEKNNISTKAVASKELLHMSESILDTENVSSKVNISSNMSNDIINNEKNKTGKNEKKKQFDTIKTSEYENKNDNESGKKVRGSKRKLALDSNSIAQDSNDSIAIPNDMNTVTTSAAAMAITTTYTPSSILQSLESSDIFVPTTTNTSTGTTGPGPKKKARMNAGDIKRMAQEFSQADYEDDIFDTGFFDNSNSTYTSSISHHQQQQQKQKSMNRFMDTSSSSSSSSKKNNNILVMNNQQSLQQLLLEEKSSLSKTTQQQQQQQQQQQNKDNWKASYIKKLGRKVKAATIIKDISEDIHVHMPSTKRNGNSNQTKKLNKLHKHVETYNHYLNPDSANMEIQSLNGSTQDITTDYKLNPDTWNFQKGIVKPLSDIPYDASLSEDEDGDF